MRARPVVLEPDLGGTDGRVGESLGPGEGLERPHVPVEDVLAEQPLLENAAGRVAITALSRSAAGRSCRRT